MDFIELLNTRQGKEYISLYKLMTVSEMPLNVALLLNKVHVEREKIVTPTKEYPLPHCVVQATVSVEPDSQGNYFHITNDDFLEILDEHLASLSGPFIISKREANDV